MSFLGNLFGAGPNNNQKTANTQLNAFGQNSLNAGMNYIGASEQDFSPPRSYYSQILSGNPSAVAGAIAPETNQLSTAFRNARQQVDQFSPMGGGRSSTMANLPFQQASAITNLISQARQNAARGLTDVAGTEGQLGTGLFGVGTGAAAAFGGLALQQHQFQYQAGNQIGQGIGAIIAGLP